MERGSWVAAGTPGSAEHDVGVVLDVCGDTARVRWFKAREVYVEAQRDLREPGGLRFQITIDESLSGGEYFSELFRGGMIAATGGGETPEHAARDAARNYRLKRNRRRARNAHTRPTVRP